MKNKVLKGSFFVALGASSYGMLATFVKMAYREGYNTAEVALSQYSLGLAGLIILSLFRKRLPVQEAKPTDIKSIAKLIGAGSSIGLTSIFYYKAVQYIPVSIAIVLLMQAVWMGVILEMVLHKKGPGWRKISSVLIILAGTILATNMTQQPVGINWVGFVYGTLAALCYTVTMYTTNNIELRLPPLTRSLFMIMGSLLMIVLIFHTSINPAFPLGIFMRWGIVLSLFGTIIPPLLFTRGMPLTGMGLGVIIAALEIPVTVLMAWLVLKERVGFFQWMGVVLILAAVVLMNVEKEKKS